MNPLKNRFQLHSLYSYLQRQAENEKFLKYLEVSGTFLLIALFLFLAITPTALTISSLLGEIKSREDFIKKADAKIDNLLIAQDNYTQFQEQYSLLDESFPSAPHYYNGVSNISTIFRDSLLEINNVSVDLINEDTGQPNYVVKVVGQGPYNSIMTMVKKLTNNRRLSTPITLNLSQPQTDTENINGSTNINVSLSNDIYYLPENNGKK